MRCLSCEDWQRRDAVNKAEIARLAVEREQYRQVVKGLQQDWAEAQEKIARLREAIKRASHPNLNPERWDEPCTCELCKIAREGR